MYENKRQGVIMLKEEVLSYAAGNKGMISTQEAKELNISPKSLQRLAQEGELERVARGLYLHKDFFADPFYLAQYRSPKAIYSHSTALYLHGLSDENPERLTMTVPSGWNSALLEEEDLYKFYYYKKEIWEIGQEELTSPYGHTIVVYNKERSLCDSILKIDEIGRDIVTKAIIAYIRSDAKDVAKLYHYAEKFKIKEKVRIYLEVSYEV
jgi:predicted transcriptional regulator of viral defense system